MNFSAFKVPNFTRISASASLIAQQLNIQYVDPLKHVSHEPKTKNSKKKEKNQIQKEMTSEDVFRELENLTQQIQECKKATQLSKDNTNKFQNLNLDQILPVSQNQANDATNEADPNANAIDSLEALGLDKLSTEDRIAEMRRHPELLKMFINESNRQKQLVKKKRIEDDFKKRKAQQNRAKNLLQDRYIPPITPLIDNFINHNKKQLQDGQFYPEVSQRRSQQQSLEREIKIKQTLANKDYQDAEFEQRAIAKQLKPIAEKLLPQTFILQRNKLLPIVYLASKLAFLHDVSAAYAEIHASNCQIESGSLVISREFRCFRAVRDWKNQRNSAILLQRKTREFNNRMHFKRRIESLKSIKELLLQEYNNNVFLGGISKSCENVSKIHSFLQFLNQRKIARKGLIQIVLDKVDQVSTLEYVRECELKEYNKKLAVMKADIKQKRQASKMPVYTSSTDPAFQPDITKERLILDSLADKIEIYSVIVECIYSQYVSIRKDDLENQWRATGGNFVYFIVDQEFCMQACKKAREIGLEIEDGVWGGAEKYKTWMQSTGEQVVPQSGAKE
ncbi:hypothetical protein SS50377_26994 [Spironucleus salmonicida]|uniref:Uncharacterized protein n=1 Tax=Spironucleus salmonicida TaxID=348837 RepID=V6LSD2_9EUKA|nr:hypothetical protein SS50377_26994 [Spironucleus salmonicida]|eukprot:EST47505.1 hypothetical protein SS50377_12490 [Spironucleus salmonicida]